MVVYKSNNKIHCLFTMSMCSALNKRLAVIIQHTCSSLIATHELDGNPCSIGTRNCKQPLQCPISNIIQIRLNIRMKTEAIFRN